MAAWDDYVKKVMTTKSASAGGLQASNYTAPYGLRAFTLPNGSYGGQMMPKTTGWMGEIPSLQGGSITEYSLGGNTPSEPFYPMVTENMTMPMISNLQKLEAGLLSERSAEAEQLRRNAYDNYLRKKALGQSAFKDYN